MSLSSAYSKSRTFQLHMLSQQGHVQEDGRGHSQESWLKLAKVIFNTIWCHTQYVNWRGFGWAAVIAAQGQAGHWSTGGEQLHCAPLFFYIPVSLLLFFYFILLSYSTIFVSTHELGFFFILFLIPLCVCKVCWVISCMVFSCQLELQHKKMSPFPSNGLRHLLMYF